MSLVNNWWFWVYNTCGQDDFCVGLYGTGSVASVVFWFWSILFGAIMITEKPSWIHKYKVQMDQNSPMDYSKLWKAVRVATFNQIFIGLPMAIIVYPLGIRMGCTADPEKLPSAMIVVRDLLIFAAMNEVGFYYSHRLFHYGPLYRAFHKQHHEWTAPLTVVAQYAHPLEQIVANILPVILGPNVMGSHFFTHFVWYALALTVTCVHHSGFHMPLLPSPQFHDYHHLKFHANFGTLGILDWLHGTDSGFRGSVYHKRHRTLWSTTPIHELYPDKQKDN